MTEVQRKYLEWVGFNDYEIQEVETEIKNGEEIFVFEGFQFYAWESGYNKANEWHYPSKGEYPKDEKEVLVYMWGSFYIGSYKQYTDDNNTWHFNDFDEESEQITAWKEIVLPKESE